MTVHPTHIEPPAGSRSRDRLEGSEFAVQELWRLYWEGDQAARENLILNYAPLVKLVAGRLGSRLPSQVEEGDLISFGLTGLLGAIERYDPERGVKFEAFAPLRIRGAMLDALRSLDWVPRRVRQEARAIEQLESSLRGDLGRTPSETEVADGLGLGVAAFRQRLLEIDNSRIYSFDAPLRGHGADGPGGDASLLDLMPSRTYADPQKALDASEGAGELTVTISEAIADLPERQQFILSCRYRDDLRLREISEVMGISESRVSQLHTKALISLRTAIGVVSGCRSPQPAHTWN